MSPRQTGLVPLAPRRLRLPYLVVAVPRSATAVWEGSASTDAVEKDVPPRIFKAFSCLPSCLIASRQTGWCPKTLVTAAAARSPPRYCNRRRHSPALVASYPSRAGIGQRSFQRQPRGGGGGFLQRPPASRDLRSPPDPRSATSRQAAGRRHVATMYMYDACM